VHTGLFDVGVAEPLGSWVLAADDATPLDLVLACAGVSAGPAPDGSPEGLALATLQVRSNLLGTVHTIEPLLPRLMARRRGQIAVVASVAGLRGLPFSPAYSASKAGIRAYGEGLRAFLAPSGVRVSVVVPGFFDTPMTDRFKGDKPFLKTLPQMVARVRRGLDRGAARIVYPQLLALGLVAADLLPAWAGDRILRGVRFHIDPGQ
jgi:NAD(P)-dependent dehydrogenase (short-subunit alcohol dehydrogenase family)